jgi:choline dehydrogenase
MGTDSDPMTVLDSGLKERGVTGLQVVDCSAIPALPSGNTNWPAVMMAEKKVADLILNRKI